MHLAYLNQIYFGSALQNYNLIEKNIYIKSCVYESFGAYILCTMYILFSLNASVEYYLNSLKLSLEYCKHLDVKLLHIMRD